MQTGEGVSGQWLNGEYWLSEADTVCAGSWVEEQWGWYDNPADCQATCKSEYEDCTAFGFCGSCYTTQCWVCRQQMSDTSWVKKIEADVVLYTPGSVCAAGSAAPTGVIDSAECKICPRGFWAPPHATLCYECAVGKYANDVNQTECLVCPSKFDDICGDHGSCKGDGSDVSISMQEIRTIGCRCLPGWEGTLCDTEVDDDHSRFIALAVLVSSLPLRNPPSRRLGFLDLLSDRWPVAWTGTGRYLSHLHLPQLLPPLHLGGHGR